MRLIIFEAKMRFDSPNGFGSNCALMQDSAENLGQGYGTAAVRGSVNAASFRKLTALLKRPVVIPTVVVAPPVSVVMAPIVPVPEAPIAPIVESVNAVEASVPQIVTVAQPDTDVLPRSGVSHLQRKPLDGLANEIDESAEQQESFTLLAPEQEAEKAELARALLDMMASSASGGQPQERALAADTLLRMLPQLPVKSKVMLAERLAMMDTPPPFLVARLIVSKDITIAGPLLEDCMHIPDEDLFALIQMGNVEKLRLLARRRRISRPIGDVLAKAEDASVLLTLVRNKGAEMSNEGFAALAQAAQNHPDLLAPMCTRQDLPVHFAFQLFWSAPAQLRRYLLSRFLTDSETLTKILKITMDQNAAEPLQEGDASLERIGEALIQIMGDDRTQGIATLAKAANVSTQTVEHILSDAQGEPLMALLKVVGVPRSELEQNISRLIQGDKPLIDPARNLDEVQAVFDQLSFNKARILLVYWDWASQKSGPYARAA